MEWQNRKSPLTIMSAPDCQETLTAKQRQTSAEGDSHIFADTTIGTVPDKHPLTWAIAIKRSMRKTRHFRGVKYPCAWRKIPIDDGACLSSRRTSGRRSGDRGKVHGSKEEEEGEESSVRTGRPHPDPLPKGEGTGTVPFFVSAKMGLSPLTLQHQALALALLQTESGEKYQASRSIKPLRMAYFTSAARL